MSLEAARSGAPATCASTKGLKMFSINVVLPMPLSPTWAGAGEVGFRRAGRAAQAEGMADAACGGARWLLYCQNKLPPYPTLATRMVSVSAGMPPGGGGMSTVPQLARRMASALRAVASQAAREAASPAPSSLSASLAP